MSDTLALSDAIKHLCFAQRDYEAGTVGGAYVADWRSAVIDEAEKMRDAAVARALAAERARVVGIVQGLLDAVPKKYEGGKLNHDWRSYDEGAADALDEALQALTAAPRGTTTEAP